jgi:biotin transport system substrate-specific component
MALYLAEGAAGLPVFNPLGLGGIPQLLGPTGGYLLAYPFMAWVAGWIMERGSKTFLRAIAAGVLAEAVLFAGGLSWLYLGTHSLAKAAQFGLYWFLFAEGMKIAAAASLATGWRLLRPDRA